MGWKSTKAITRDRAIRTIGDCLSSLSDEVLADIVETVNDNCEFPLGHGFNFIIGGVDVDFEEYKRLKEKYEGGCHD